MRTVLRISLWVLASVVTLTAAAFLYLTNADLSVHEEQIEGFLSETIGHQLDVDGLLELRFGELTQVTAQKITLSNADWQPDPVIVSVGHFSMTVDLWSLVFSPVIIEDLDIRDIHVRLERNAESQANWESGRTGDEVEQQGEVDPELIAFKKVRMQDLQFSFTDPARRRPLNVTLDHLTVNPDENNILDLDLRGMINDIPLRADGKLGPWENLLDGQEITADLNLTLARVRLAIDGSIADLPSLAGIDMTLRLSGPAIDGVTETLGLPPFAEGAFQVDGRIRELDDGNELRLEGNLGAISIFASGNVDKLIDPGNIRLDFNFTGPDTRYVAEVFGIDGASAVPFQVSGNVNKEGSRLAFSETHAQLGADSFSFNGWLDVRGSIPDGDVTVNASGPDFSIIGPFTGIQGIPSEAFKIDGRIQKTGASWQFDDVEAVVGKHRLAANGALGRKGSAETELTFNASGPDLSILQAMTGLEGLSARPFDVYARVKPDRVGIMLENAKGVFGDHHLDIDGVIGTGRGLTGTNLRFHADGPELNNVALLTGIPYLPDGPFEFGGRVRIDRDQLHLSEVTATAGGMRGSANGTVELGDDLGEFDLELSASGPDLAKLMQVAWLERMSGEAFGVDGRVRHRGAEYELDAVNALIGNFEVSIDGELASSGETVDISLSASSPDATVLGKLSGLEDLPDGPVSFNGRIEKTSTDLEFTDAEAHIGDYSFAADGAVSTAPLSNRSDLRFSASGPELQQLGLPFDFDVLPAMPFSVSGEVNGVPTGFVVEELVARLGDNKIDGRFTADFSDKPEVTGVLSSPYLDLTVKLPPVDAEATVADEQEGEFLISNETLELEWLRVANVDVKFKADQLKIRQGELQDFNLGLKLWAGVLDIDEVSFGDTEGGKISGRVHLGPLNGSHVFDFLLHAEDVRLHMRAMENQQRSTLPSLSGRLELRGTGNSLHELMASSNGVLSFTQGAGRIQDLVSLGVFGPLGPQVIHALVPTMRTAEEYVTLQCGIYDIDVKDGIATIENLAIQTDNMTLATRGSVNFGNEQMNVDVRVKPRKGVGVSIGMVANSYLELGGTLQSPSLQIDATHAAAATSAIIATGGLSIIAKGLWDRAAAEIDICEDQAKEDVSQ